MKVLWLGLEFMFAVVALVLVCLFCAYAWPESTYGLAAWVQAIGSILAVGAAILVSRLQFADATRLENGRRKSVATRNILTVKAIYNEIATFINLMSKGMDADRRKEIDEVGLVQFINCRDALAALPLFEIEDHKVVVDLIAMKQWITRFLEKMETAKTYIADHDQRYAEAETEEQEERFAIAEALGENEKFDAEYTKAMGAAINSYHDLRDMTNAAMDNADLAISQMA